MRCGYQSGSNLSSICQPEDGKDRETRGDFNGRVARPNSGELIERKLQTYKLEVLSHLNMLIGISFLDDPQLFSFSVAAIGNALYYLCLFIHTSHHKIFTVYTLILTIIQKEVKILGVQIISSQWC